MKTKWTMIFLVAGLIVLLVLTGRLGLAQGPEDEPPVSVQAVLASAFTYQGQLSKAGNPVNGSADFQFSLWDAANGGTQVGSTQTLTALPVSGGTFTGQLDFGTSAFNGDQRWLEIALRYPAGSGSYTTLSPRQPVLPVPYALHASDVPWSGLAGVPAGFADGTDNDTTYTAGTGLMLAGNQLSVSFAGSGSASTAARSDHNHDSSYWGLGGNSGVSASTNRLGTTDNVSLTLVVNNMAALRLEPNSTSPNVVGGFDGNSVTSGAYGATIGGGGSSGSINTVVANYGTVSGGKGNTSSGDYATVGGGIGNTASSDYGTIGGGANNFASGSYYATVAGGGLNTASGNYSAVGGGYNNSTSGSYATVGGGSGNIASGDYGFAAGRLARANHLGAFVWADGNNISFASTAINEFSVRATGGARFVSAINGSGVGTAGVSLAPGGGSWSSLSDRDSKEGFTNVDAQEVLAHLATIPIETWSYKAQDPSIRHMGPVAQDFYAAFGLGEDDRSISTVDADGVALAAIQGLLQTVQEKDARIAKLETQNAAQQQAIDDLQKRMEALEGRGSGASNVLAPSSLLTGGWSILGLFVVGGIGFWQIRRRSQ